VSCLVFSVGLPLMVVFAVAVDFARLCGVVVTCWLRLLLSRGWVV